MFFIGLNIQHHTCDITSPSSVQEVATSIRSTLGNPTLLINNAGIGTGLPILDSTDEINRRVFDVNVLSHFRLVREFLPAMITANHGTVVTIASVAACVSAPSLVDYSSSKSAALSFHEGLAAELKTLYEAPKVRTICVCPSWIETNMAKQVKLTDKFVVPMLRVETVAEKVVEKITSGNSGVVVVSCNFLLSVILLGWSTGYPAMESRGADHGFVLSDFKGSFCLCQIFSHKQCSNCFTDSGSRKLGRLVSKGFTNVVAGVPKD